MEVLPDDVELLLVRGLGRYITEAPLGQLPASVRRFKGFRGKALARHSATILALLDEDASRALILQWLDDDKPSLPGEVAGALRIAAERSKGWAQELAALSSDDNPDGGPEGGEAERLEAALEKERGKTARAREAAKKEKAELQSVLAEEKAERARLERRAAELELELDRTRSEIEELRSRSEQDLARAERELRRARSTAEKAAASEREASERLRSAEVELERYRAAAEAPAVKPKRKPPAPRKKPRTGERRVLKVPKGRLADEPEVLDAWLQRDDVHLIVDGYNVTKSETGYPELELENQRERLIADLIALSARRKVDATVVFDGSSVTRLRSTKSRVKVVFTDEGEIADDAIVEMVEKMPPFPVIVATNDRELQERVTALGATVATSAQLLVLLR